MADIECCFCRATAGCKHLLAVIDRSNGTIEGGFLCDHETAVRDALLDRVLVLLAGPRLSAPGKKSTSYPIEELFPGIKNLGPNVLRTQLSDELDVFVYLDFIDEVFSEVRDVQRGESCIEEEDDDQDEEGYPGSETVDITYYAKDCAGALVEAVARIETWKF